MRSIRASAAFTARPNTAMKNHKPSRKFQSSAFSNTPHIPHPNA